MSDPVLIEREGAVATVILNRPPHNPIGLEMVDQLEREIPALAADASVRAVVITGAGERTFSVGADIRQFGEGVARMTLRGFIEQRLRLLERIEQLEKPVVCAIRGHCVGGGLELALSCHFRIAAEGARLGLPEIDLGILPAWSGTQRLTRIVGRAHALDIMLRARKLDVAEALRIGMIHQSCEPDELRACSDRLARELAMKPPLAVAGILRAVVQGEFRPLYEGLALELEALTRTSASQDAREGVMAFFEKRKPVFRGE